MDATDHQHYQKSLQNPSTPPFTISIETCCKCSSPTTFPPPPPSWFEILPPPTYRLIRAPAIPSNTNSQRATILAPVPQAQKVPVVSPPYHFQASSKKIQSPDDIRHFHDSGFGKNFIGFVVALSESIRGHKILDPCSQSDTVNCIIAVLDSLIQWVEAISPVQQADSYGNITYRTWHSRLVETSESLMLHFLPENLHMATTEIVHYKSITLSKNSNHTFLPFLVSSWRFKSHTLSSSPSFALSL